MTQFLERDPGAYRLSVAFPASRYRDWDVVPHGVDLAVTGGCVTVAEVQARPTGTLTVEIREEESQALIRGTAEIRASGAASLSHLADGGRHTFSRVACGAYDVSARLSERYHGQTVSRSGVNVPESGVGLARLFVGQRTWVEIELVDEEGAGVEGQEYSIVTPDGQEKRGRTDAKGWARVEGIVAGTCRISFPALDRTDWHGI
jgi:hypothetical protein